MLVRGVGMIFFVGGGGGGKISSETKSVNHTIKKSLKLMNDYKAKKIEDYAREMAFMIEI